MTKICIFIVAGTALAFWSGGLPDPLWYTFIPILLLLIWFVPQYRYLSLIVASFLWASLQIQFQLDKNLIEEFDAETVLVSGTIDDIVEVRQDSIRFILKPESIENYQRSLPDRIRLSWYQDKIQPKAGERWQLLVKLRKPWGFQNPGGFDFQRWLFVERIGATGYVRRSKENRKLAEPAWWDMNQYRSRLSAAISKQCTGCEHAGLFKALVLGFRGDIDKNQRRVLQESGTVHLIAISGLHIGLIAALFYFIGRLSWTIGLHRFSMNRIECSAIISLLAATAYAALAGFSLPTTRALIMLAVIVMALLFRRGVNLLNSIAIALSLILVFDPLSVGSASLWLSISALLVIALGQYLMQNQGSWIKQLLVIQLLFSVLFIPLTMLLFQQASAAVFLANLIAIPVVSFILLPLVLVASVIAITELSISAWLFQFADLIMSVLFGYLHLLLESGLGIFRNSGVPHLLLFCAAAGLLLLLLPVNPNLRRAAIMLIVLPVMWQPASFKPGEYQLTVLDVGMGTSIVVETETHNLIFDFGPGNNRGFSAGDWVIRPYLQHRGIEKVDLMIISHVDRDHSGGFVSFLNEVQAGQLLSGTRSEVQQRFRLDFDFRSCHDYPAWRWDGVEFEFLSSLQSDSTQSTNNRSCVLKITGHQTSLLSGDIEADQESRLVSRYGDALAADMLVVPHHGSLTSSTVEFVKKVSPRVVVFTVGRNNRWGFPREEIVARYKTLESQIYRTDQHGAVSFISTMGGLHRQSYRQSRQRLWH